MKKKIKYSIIGCISVGASLLVTSCDTREDWFQKEGEGATFVFVNGERKDTIDFVGLREVEYTVHLIRADKSYIWSDTLNLQVYGMTNRTKVRAGIDRITTAGSYDDYNNLSIEKEKKSDGSFNLFHYSGYNGLNLFKNPIDNKEEANIIGYSNLYVKVRDIFENQYTGHIKITFMGDCPPTPVLTVKDVAGKPMEKVLSMADSYDEDGTVAKYEYCIDGNVTSYKATSNRFDNISGVWQSGKAAYGGTYITATALNEISHAFQEPGEHVVYYRCMDNVGAWSMWNKETVTIK